MAIGDTITQPIPVVGTAGTLYASQLVNFLTETKARLEALIPLSSLLIAPLDMAGNGIFDLGYAALYPQADEPASPIGSLQYFEDNLWWVSSAGAFAITDGNALDSTSIGGITGDFGGSNPARVRFTDSTKLYDFWDDFAGLARAHIGMATADIYGTTTSTTRVRVGWAGSPDTSYSLTLPAALPTSTKVRFLSINDTGQILTTQSVTDSLAVAGAIAAGTSVTGATLAYTTALSRSVSPFAAGAPGSSGAVLDISGYWRVGANVDLVYYPLQTHVGDIVTSWSVACTKNSDATSTIFAALYYQTAAGVQTQIGTTKTSAAAGPASVTLGETPASPITAGSGDVFYLKVGRTVSGDATADNLKNATFLVTHPA